MGLGFGGEGEVKAGATRGVFASPQAAAMRFNNGTADGESHTSAMKLGGKEGFEDLVGLLLRRKSDTGVADRHRKVLVLRALRLDGELAGSIHIFHGIDA